MKQSSTVLAVKHGLPTQSIYMKYCSSIGVLKSRQNVSGMDKELEQLPKKKIT